MRNLPYCICRWWVAQSIMMLLTSNCPISFRRNETRSSGLCAWMSRLAFSLCLCRRRLCDPCKGAFITQRSQFVHGLPERNQTEEWQPTGPRSNARTEHRINDQMRVNVKGCSGVNHERLITSQSQCRFLFDDFSPQAVPKCTVHLHHAGRHSALIEQVA